MRSIHLMPTLAVAIAMSISACSSAPEEPKAPPAPYTVSSTQVTLEGSITGIDKTNRIVTIQGSDGTAQEFAADEGVRNFEQLQVGDRVALDYNSALAVEIKPAGTAEVGTSTQEDDSLAAFGAKPGASTSQTVTIVAEVMGVDTAANTITLKGPRGNVVTLDVVREELRARLATVKVGDLLKTTFTEAIAVNIRPRP